MQTFVVIWNSVGDAGKLGIGFALFFLTAMLFIGSFALTWRLCVHLFPIKLDDECNDECNND